jgi:hypothetical protein
MGIDSSPAPAAKGRFGGRLARSRRPRPRHALPAGSTRRTGDGTTVALIAVLVLTSGFVAGTTAAFSGSTTNGGNTFVVSALNQPSSPGGGMDGTTMKVTWSNATDTQATPAATSGYRIYRKQRGSPAANGTAPTCSGGLAAYAQLTDVATGPITDATVSGFAQGGYLCYKIVTIWPFPVVGTPWLAQGLAPEKALQTGYVLSSWSWANYDGNANKAGTGDQLIFNFNQDVDTTTGPTTSETVCVLPQASPIIRVGDSQTTNNNCTTSGGTTSVGYATGPSTMSGNQVRFNIRTPQNGGYTQMWNDCSVANKCKTLVVELGSQRGGNAVPTMAVGSWTGFTTGPTGTKLKSATGALTVCTTNATNGLCRPTSTQNW